MIGSNVTRNVPARGVSVRGTACAFPTPGASPGITRARTRTGKRISRTASADADAVGTPSGNAGSRSGDRGDRRAVLRVNHDPDGVRDQLMRRRAGVNAVQRERTTERTPDRDRIACVALWEIGKLADLPGIRGEGRELPVRVEVRPAARRCLSGDVRVIRAHGGDQVDELTRHDDGFDRIGAIEIARGTRLGGSEQCGAIGEWDEHRVTPRTGDERRTRRAIRAYGE